ncbi:MAG: hypothetical protein JST28_22090 [Acidobacteria bacterium]|nr:hypothetical protein [Acidobacteriota bacterium]
MTFSLLAFVVMGYHPGTEDDGVYLTAVKSDLNPALYPHDSDFFRVQLQATLFDRWIAGFVRLTHIPLAGTELIFQFASIVVMLAACWTIARTLFEDERVQWAGVALVAAMLTLPVSGTAIYLADQHLHPRNMASALVLLAVSRILRDKLWQAVPLLLVSFVLHPIMALLGISFCFFLTMALLEPVHAWLRSLRDALASAVPLGWIFESPTAAWRRALETRSYYFLYRWTWYEWLGALGPIALFWLLWRIALKRGEERLARFALAVFAYGVVHQVASMVVIGSPAFVRLMPMQPMRFLHLVYVFMVLIGGCLLGKYLLKASAPRWAAFLVIACFGMYASQRALFAATPHLELPGATSSNPWLQSFEWIRGNTPSNAYFALDPGYLAAPGEDYHSFRALAERSQLADMIKDPAVVTQVPELGPDWEKQTGAQAGWEHFKLADFERLNRDFGVDWVVVNYPQPDGLNCRWHNWSLAVCQIPNLQASSSR